MKKNGPLCDVCLAQVFVNILIQHNQSYLKEDTMKESCFVAKLPFPKCEDAIVITVTLKHDMLYHCGQLVSGLV